LLLGLCCWCAPTRLLALRILRLPATRLLGRSPTLRLTGLRAPTSLTWLTGLRAPASLLSLLSPTSLSSRLLALPIGLRSSSVSCFFLPTAKDIQCGDQNDDRYHQDSACDHGRVREQSCRENDACESDNFTHIVHLSSL
jgi:hypothetical protein